MTMNFYRPIDGFKEEAYSVDEFVNGDVYDPKLETDIGDRFLSHLWMSLRLAQGDDIEIISDTIDELREFGMGVDSDEVIDTIHQYCHIHFGYPPESTRTYYLYWVLSDPDNYILKHSTNPNNTQISFTKYQHRGANEIILYYNRDTGEYLIASTIPVEKQVKSGERYIYSRTTRTNSEGVWNRKVFSNKPDRLYPLSVGDVVIRGGGG